ncbi:nuclear transport factor 2 family protein [Mycobacterium simulans]|nr:nuclear transport factor 2 family protein [Mycobacterium simulans]
MLYRWFVRKRARVLWDRLSDQRIDEIPIADDVHFVYLGDHPLSTELRGADQMRDWLRNVFFRRLPGLRFEVEEMLVEGGPWSTRIATRYAARRDGKLVYRGVQFTRIVWGKLVEERVLPDSNALSAALD